MVIHYLWYLGFHCLEQLVKQKKTIGAKTVPEGTILPYLYSFLQLGIIF